MGQTEYTVEVSHTLSGLDSDAWNAMVDDHNPFLSYEFLSALEKNHCLGEHTGWHPQHFLIKSADGKLIAAAPAYIKMNSFGEFVFDWAWASAYQRAGLEYYPKLVLAVPFTPVTGQRLLIDKTIIDTDALRKKLVQSIIEYCENQSLSSAHCLFPKESDMAPFLSENWLERSAYQYHWQNDHYRDFESFLSHFKSRKRKKTRRERAYAKDNDIRFSIKLGNELSETEWIDAYHFYQTTFSEKGNFAALSLEFFLALSKTIGDQIVVIFAQKNNKNIAGAINFKSNSRLYGRYWGSVETHNCLHFETCFYQGIDYCIQNNLSYFEPGAQGEHKITRGFLPVKTYSAHWIADPRFKLAIEDFLQRESEMMLPYKTELDSLSPFKCSDLDYDPLDS